MSLKSRGALHRALLLLVFWAPSTTLFAAPDAPSGRELLLRGEIAPAIRSLQADLKQNPKNEAETHHLLARAYYSLGKWDAAVDEGEKSVAISPNTSDYHLWLGRAYGEKAERASWFTAVGIAKKVRAHFERAVELNGDNLGARSDLAEFYLEAPGFLGGGVDKARNQAEAVKAKDAAEAHWIQARVAEKSGDNAQAEREYKAAVKESGNRPDHWLNLAGFYRKQNRYPEMEATIQQAVQALKRPDNSLLDAAGLLLRAGRNLPQAAQYAQRYIAAPEKNEDAPAFRAHYVLGQILEKQGDRAGAAREYQAALQLAQDFPDAQDALRRVSH